MIFYFGLILICFLIVLSVWFASRQSQYRKDLNTFQIFQRKGPNLPQAPLLNQTQPKTFQNTPQVKPPIQGWIKRTVFGSLLIFAILVFLFKSSTPLWAVLYFSFIVCLSTYVNLQGMVPSKFSNEKIKLFDHFVSFSSIICISGSLLFLILWFFVSQVCIINNIISISIMVFFITVVRFKALKSITKLLIIFFFIRLLTEIIIPAMIQKSLQGQQQQQQQQPSEMNNSSTNVMGSGVILQKDLLTVIGSFFGFMIPSKIILPTNICVPIENLKIPLSSITLPGFFLAFLYRYDTGRNAKSRSYFNMGLIIIGFVNFCSLIYLHYSKQTTNKYAFFISTSALVLTTLITAYKKNELSLLWKTSTREGQTFEQVKEIHVPNFEHDYNSLDLKENEK
ncbi:signal peptide peptidase [Anaeramoeba flamelloides]|uniref:Signal peptide peptidase n=1 Tax=Anaeramoeba flamelloides TaxID=1746091 RepID=A0ABQ8Z1T8_9EUKA|nr:signal peptide peptidase [Anaeramoeba flamelloides]